MEERIQTPPNLSINRKRADPPIQGPLRCQYCKAREFPTMKALARHLGSCPARVFPRGFTLDDHAYTYMANRNRRLERGLESWLVDIASSTRATAQQRSDLVRGGLAFLVHMHLIRDVKVAKADQAPAVGGIEPPERRPRRDFTAAPAREMAPVLTTGEEVAAALAARAGAPVAASGTTLTAAELKEGERISPSLTKATLEGRITPSEFRERLATARRRL